ncbi:MAG: hypothetical protein KGL39_18605 [Patescibacteria group bacterium]|nr:hypothetical protein [Patescibacteria group bacterium]
MRTTRINKIKAAIERIDKFQAWFRTLPAEHINLDILMSSRSRWLEVNEPLRKLKHCGAVGCVLGWMKHYIYARDLSMDATDFSGGVFFYENLFQSRARFDMPQREEALLRLARQKAGLQLVLDETVSRQRQRTPK